ncbi:MAG: RDD family protein [Planctomycetes bacterium]|nr:RDD family protein [Planctomycetota bacterium]
MRQLKITTPDHVVFHRPVAGLSTRAAAWFLDQGLLAVVKVGLLVVCSWFGSLGLGVLLPLILLLDGAYFSYFEWRRQGQTPGKRALRLRVATVTGARLTGYEAVLRNVLRLVDNLPVLMLAGGVVAFFDPLGRRLGDLAAGTVVIREKANGTAPPAVEKTRPNTLQENAACRRRILARATRDDRDIAFDLMWRRDALRPESREELFALVAAAFRQRFSLPENDALSDEQLVLDVALILADREDERRSG